MKGGDKRWDIVSAKNSDCFVPINLFLTGSGSGARNDSRRFCHPEQNPAQHGVQGEVRSHVLE